MDNMNFTQNIKELRQRRGFSQEELAEKSGLSIRTIQRIENGETEPRGDSLKRLSGALGVTPDDLVDWTIQEDKAYLRYLNLSSLSFLAVSALGIIVPLILWLSKRDKIKGVNCLGKQIINFQITWHLFFFLIVIVAAGFLAIPLYRGLVTEKEIMGRIYAVMIIILIMILYNTGLVLLNHYRLKKGKQVRYFPYVKFLK